MESKKVDSILSARSILDKKSWLFFKIYKDPTSALDWKSSLDWYHNVLMDVIKPIVLNTPEIRVALFGFYGPVSYAAEGEAYERQITSPTTNTVFIRLRISVRKGGKKKVKNKFLMSLGSSRALVWDYELMTTYNVRNDLGGRFGSNLDSQTLEFVRYWDAACRYILSILTLPGNWVQNVDVWGMPHLVNNSLGAWLRPERDPVTCPNCQAHMYMKTVPTSVAVGQPPVLQIQVPCFLFVCPNCPTQFLNSINI